MKKGGVGGGKLTVGFWLLLMGLSGLCGGCVTTYYADLVIVDAETNHPLPNAYVVSSFSLDYLSFRPFGGSGSPDYARVKLYYPDTEGRVTIPVYRVDERPGGATGAGWWVDCKNYLRRTDSAWQIGDTGAIYLTRTQDELRTPIIFKMTSGHTDLRKWAADMHGTGTLLSWLMEADLQRDPTYSFDRQRLIPMIQDFFAECDELLPLYKRDLETGNYTELQFRDRDSRLFMLKRLISNIKQEYSNYCQLQERGR